MSGVNSVSGNTYTSGNEKKTGNNTGNNEAVVSQNTAEPVSNETIPTTSQIARVSVLEFKNEVSFLDSQIKSKGITLETVQKINQFNTLMAELSASGVNPEDIAGLTQSVSDLKKMLDSIPASTKRNPQFSAVLGKFEQDFKVFETLVNSAGNASDAHKEAIAAQAQAENDVTKASEDFLRQNSFNPLANSLQRTVQDYNRVMQDPNASEYHKIVMTTLMKKLTDKITELKGKNLSDSQLEKELTGVFAKHQQFMSRLTGPDAVTIQELRDYAPELLEQVMMDLERKPVINPVGTTAINADIIGLPETTTGNTGNVPETGSGSSSSGGNNPVATPDPVRFRDLPPADQEKLIMATIKNSIAQSPPEIQQIVNGPEKPEEMFRGVTMRDLQELTDLSTEIGRSFARFSDSVTKLTEARQRVAQTHAAQRDSLQHLNDFVNSLRFENMVNNLANFSDIAFDLEYLLTQSSLKQIVREIIAEADKLSSELDLEMDAPEVSMVSLLQKLRSIISELDENTRNLIKEKLNAKLIDINFMKTRKDNSDDIDRKDNFWKMMLKVFEESKEVKAPKAS